MSRYFNPDHRRLRAAHFVGAPLLVVAGVVGALGNVYTAVVLFVQPNWVNQIIASVTLSAIVLLLIGYVAFREFSVVRKERFANCTHHLKTIMRRIRKLDLLIDHCLEKGRPDPTTGVLQIPDADTHLSTAIQMLSEILDEIKNAFSLLSGTRCRAVVKLISGHDGTDGGARAYAYTLCRDSNSNDECEADDARKSKEAWDRIIGNTDFDLLYDPNKADDGFFFSNDLMKQPDYQSTSIKWLRNLRGGKPVANEGQWLLPYRSTIVWPIRTKASDFPYKESTKIFGFLAVDSESRNAFEKRWDVPFGDAFATALYEPIRKLRYFKDQPAKNE